jgi:hypothetical protein
MLIIPTLERRYILIALFYGAILLGWLTPEDNTVLVVSVLGAGLSLLMVNLAIRRWFGGYPLPKRYWLPSAILVGVGVGFGAVWGTVGLMIFKNAWHSHAYPDFASIVIVGMFRRLIPWSVAGGFLGAAVGLWQLGLIESRRNGQ